MYFIPYLFNHVYIFIGCIDFSSWLGLACIVLFLILTVHSYVAPTLNKFKKKNLSRSCFRGCECRDCIETQFFVLFYVLLFLDDVSTS